VTLTYYDAGYRRTMTDPSGSWRYDYDDAYRVQAVVYTATNQSPITVSYQFDGAGNRKKMGLLSFL
jgi:VCBS repeat-containing protein